MSCSPNQSKIKFIHCLIAGPAIDILIDDQSLLTSVEYENISSYFKISSGIHNVKVFQSGYDLKTDDPLFDVDIDLAANKNYTTVIIGDIDDPRTYDFDLLLDECKKVSNGKASVRYLNGIGPTRLTDMSGNFDKIILNANYSDVSGYMSVNSDVSLKLELTYTKGNKVSLESLDLMFDSGVSYTLIGTGRLDEMETNYPISILVSKEGNCAMCTDMSCKLY
jgi:hypothetical protein